MNEQQNNSFAALMQAFNVLAQAHIVNIEGNPPPSPAPQPEQPVDK